MQASEGLDNKVRTLLITLIGLFPFFFIPLSWVTLVQAKILLLSLVLMVAGIMWFIARFREGGVKLPWTSALIAAILVPLAYAISAACAGFKSVSLVGSGVDTDTLAFVCIGFSLFALSAAVFSMHPGKVVLALRALLGGSLVLFAMELLHFAVPTLSLGGVLAGQTGNLLGSWHEFAMFAGAVGFLSIALLQTAVTAGLWRYVAVIVGLLAGASLLISNYFDVLVLTIAALILLMALKFYRGTREGHRQPWGHHVALGVSVLIVATVLFFGVTLATLLPAGMRVVQSEVRPSLQGTFAISQQSIMKPLPLLLGTGPNTFAREWGLHKPADVNGTEFWNTEFTGGVAPLATSFITAGALGLIAWLLWMLAFLIAAVRLWVSSTETAAAAIALPLSVATLYFFAFQVISVPGVLVTCCLFICAGLTIALLAPTFVAERHIVLAHGVRHHLVFATVIVGALVLVVSAGALMRVTMAEVLVNKGIVVFNQSGDIARATADVQRAISLYPNSDRAHASAVQLGMAQLEQLAASANPDDQGARALLQATLEETIAHGLAAVNINGGSYQNWLLLATLYTQLAGSDVDGAYDSARLAFEQALKENPTSPITHVNLARLEMARQHPDAALQSLARAVELKPNLAVAHYLASHIYTMQGKYDAALSSAVNAAKYAPEDAEAWYNLGVIAYGATTYSDAAAALQQALVIQPRFANALYVLGLTLYQAGQHENALLVFQALKQLDQSATIVDQIIGDIAADTPLSQEVLNGQAPQAHSAQ